MNQNPENHTIIVTGCNRGLGLELLKIIIAKNPSIDIIATVRSNKDELQLKLNSEFIGNKIVVMEVDLDRKQSILKFIEQITQMNIRFDALINNAAVMFDKIGNNSEFLSNKDVKITFDVNYYGTVALTKEIVPLLKQNGRVINVSSSLSALKYHSENIQNIFSSLELTETIIDEQINRYIKGCEIMKLEQFYNHGYGTSKMILNAWSRFILPKMLKSTQFSIVMSPGHCRTDMGGPTGTRSPREGALSIYTLLWGQYSSQVFYHARGPTNFENCTI